MSSFAHWPLLFLLLALITGSGTGWLLWRGRRRRAMVAALLLALLCSGSGFMAFQLAQSAPAFTLPPPRAGHFQTIPAAALDQALLATRGQPVLLDFYADWCSSCQVWQKDVFSRPDVEAALAPFTLLRIDATEMTPETQQALNRFDLAGLPALVSFNSQGAELKDLRILGEMTAGDFIRDVNSRILPAARKRPG